ncbi:MAG: internalization-related competence protein ComEC/Rec2 [Paenibacillaceae bacterium]|nr:internalization-related competence protein ComEC/Rec2 [Paenibacillaceae bacterium]
MNRLALTAPVCWITGAGLAAFSPGPPAKWSLVVFLLLWGLGLFFFDRKQMLKWGLLAGLLLAGNGHYHYAESKLATGIIPPSVPWNMDEDEAQVELAGTVDSPVEVDGDRAVFYARASRWTWEEQEQADSRVLRPAERVYVTVRLTDPEEQAVAADWKRGDRIVVSGTGKAAAPARNYGGFDFREYLRKNNVHWIVTVKGASSMEAAPPEGWSLTRLLRWNDQVRTAASGQLDKLFPGEEAGYMKGLLVGIREDLDPERFRDFSRLGLTHILAISGLHVGVFVWAVAAVCRRLSMTKEQTMAAAFWTIPLYVVFTGSSPSVIRAGITAMAGLFAARRGWLKDGLSLLGGTAWLMVIWKPLYVGDVGFQLSFLVTAGLLAGVPAVGRLIPIRQPWLNGSITVSLTAQMVSFPLSVYYFNQFSLLSLPANILLVPLISFVVTPLGYVAMLLSIPFPMAGSLVASLTSWLNKATFWCVEQTELFPAGQLIWPSPSYWWIAGYYFLLCAAIAVWGRRKQLEALERAKIYLSADGPRLLRHYGAAAGLACLLLTAWLAYGYSPYLLTERGNGTVAFLDVGQGDAAYIRTPGGKHLLIDGGGTVSFRKEGEEWKQRRDPYEVGRKTVVPLLKKRGVHRLDYLMISHEDTDHIGGLAAVLEEIPVDAILFNGTLKSSAATVKLFQLALEKEIPLIPVYEGDQITVDPDTLLTVLAPERPRERGIIEAEEQNSHTVAALLTMNGFRFLFAGDMGFAEETAILDRIATEPAAAASVAEAAASAAEPVLDVLKVAHHGSKNSTSGDWLSYWKPKLAVISAGVNNIYGHPHPLTLDRLTDAGTAIRRTDLQGEVQISVSRTTLRFRTKLLPSSGN